jgi:CBS domain-containing membrane protein
MSYKNKDLISPVDISNQDIIAAMQTLQGYIDITPGDFKEIYTAAYSFAVQRLLAGLKASDLMTSPVHTLQEDISLVEAAALLAERKISGAPVINRQGTITGVVSEKDFLKEMGFGKTPSFMQMAAHCLNDKSCMIRRLQGRKVGEIMTALPITGFPEMTIGEISTLFYERKINRLPITNSDKKPIGIVTRSDLAHSFSFLAREDRS